MYRELQDLVDRGEKAVVATVVRTKGSTPREVGARMVVRPRLVEVDLLHDHDLEGGRACGGIMYVFLEPLQSSSGV